MIEVKDVQEFPWNQQDRLSSQMEAPMSDFSILPVALFTGMMASFMIVLLFAVVTDRDPA